MIDLDWLSDRLCDVLRWQLANIGAHELAGPEVPWAGRRAWSMFLELNGTRTGNGFGPNPISDVEIESYSRLRREPIRSWELTILRALDAAYLKAAREMTGQAAKPAPPPDAKDIFAAFRAAAASDTGAPPHLLRSGQQPGRSR